MDRRLNGSVWAAVGAAVALACAGGPVRAQDAPTAPTPAEAVIAARNAWRAAAKPAGGDTPAALTAEWRLAIALTGAGAMAEAEGHWRRMLPVVRARTGETSLETLTIMAWLGENAVSQGAAEPEGMALAQQGYEATLRILGPDHDLTERVRLPYGTALFVAGRYAEAEPLVRASFDYWFGREGPGGNAATMAPSLAVLYQALGREDEARQVLSRVQARDAEAGASARLALLEDAGDWAGVLDLARRTAAQRRVRPDAEARFDAQAAELTAANALLRLATDGDDPRLVEAERLIQTVMVERRADPAGRGLDLAVDALSDLYLQWPGRRDLTRALALKREAVALTTAVFGPDHPQTLKRQLTLAMMLAGNGGGPEAQAALDAYGRAAAVPGAATADERAFAALASAVVSYGGGDTRGAWTRLAEASRLFRQYAVEPGRRDTAHAYLKRQSDIFRVQVTMGWRYAHDGPTRRTVPTPNDGTRAPVGD